MFRTKTLLNLGLLLIGGILMLNACKPSPQKAQDYFNRTMDCQQAVMEKEDLLIQLINTEMLKTLKDSASQNIPQSMDTAGNVKEIDAAFADFCLQIKQSQGELKKIGKFNNRTELLDAAEALLAAYRALSEKEYKEVVDIVKIPANKYTNDDDNRFLDLTEQIDTTLQSKIDNFTRASKAFAREYNFEIALSDSSASHK